MVAMYSQWMTIETLYMSMKEKKKEKKREKRHGMMLSQLQKKNILVHTRGDVVSIHAWRQIQILLKKKRGKFEYE